MGKVTSRPMMKSYTSPHCNSTMNRKDRSRQTSKATKNGSTLKRRKRPYGKGQNNVAVRKNEFVKGALLHRYTVENKGGELGRESWSMVKRSILTAVENSRADFMPRRSGLENQISDEMVWVWRWGRQPESKGNLPTQFITRYRQNGLLYKFHCSSWMRRDFDGTSQSREKLCMNVYIVKNQNIIDDGNCVRKFKVGYQGRKSSNKSPIEWDSGQRAWRLHECTTNQPRYKLKHEEMLLYNWGQSWLYKWTRVAYITWAVDVSWSENIPQYIEAISFPKNIIV